MDEVVIGPLLFGAMFQHVVCTEKGFDRLEVTKSELLFSFIDAFDRLRDLDLLQPKQSLTHSSRSLSTEKTNFGGEQGSPYSWALRAAEHFQRLGGLKREA